MQVFNIHEGQSIPIMIDQIDTDQLLPKEYLKSIKKSGFEDALFYDWRYLEEGVDNPGFILNASDYKEASILITGENFGCGSSREHAVWAVRDYGFKVIIAGSYSEIFYMNALKNGILLIILDQQARTFLAGLSSNHKIVVDLPRQQVRVDGKTFFFDIAPDWKYKLLNGLDDIDLALQYENLITEYEDR